MRLGGTFEPAAAGNPFGEPGHYCKLLKRGSIDRQHASWPQEPLDLLLGVVGAI
jgi:hypothetical protein